MAMMRFNKIRLPALPTVDLTVYPYVYITANSYETTFYLRVSPVKLIAIMDEEGDIGLITPDGIDVTGLSSTGISSGDESWPELTERTFSASEPIFYPFWCNTDICFEDGTIYLEASEPVESDIIYYYNGVALPIFPSYDKERYPYAFITKPDSGNYILRFTCEPLLYHVVNGVYTYFALNTGNDEFDYGKCVLATEHTMYFDPEITYDTAIAFDASSWIWSNYDICDAEDGTVVFAASEPSLEYVSPDDGGDTGGGTGGSGGSGDSGDSGESGDTTVYACSDWRIPFILGLFAPLTWNPTADQRLTWAALEALALIFEDVEGITWDEFEFYK